MKRLFGSIFKFLAVIAIVVLLFFGRSYVKKYVINRILGVYYIYKGDRAYHKHKLSYSIDYYNRGLTLFPSHYTAWYNLGNIYVVYEDYYSAVEAYKKAIEYNPKYAVARMNLGIIEAEKLGNFDEAIEQYDAILNIRNRIWLVPFVFNNKKTTKQNRGLAYYNKGLAYRQKALFLPEEEKGDEYGLLVQATESYEEAHKILKKNSDVLFNLALAYQLMGRYRDAGKNYCKAIELAPMNYEAHYNLSIMLRHLRRYKDSLDELEKASFLVALKSDNEDKAAYVYGILSSVSSLYSKYGATGKDPQYSQYSDNATNIENLANTDNQDVDLRDKNKKKDKNSNTNIDYLHMSDKDIDKAMMKNFKTCSGIEYFDNEDEYEY